MCFTEDKYQHQSAKATEIIHTKSVTLENVLTIVIIRGQFGYCTRRCHVCADPG